MLSLIVFSCDGCGKYNKTLIERGCISNEIYVECCDDDIDD